MSAYAIGPGLHNWDYEECERRSIYEDTARALNEAALEAWTAAAISKKDTPEWALLIDGFMEEAFNNLYSDQGKISEFNRVVFRLYAGCKAERASAENDLEALLRPYLIEALKAI